MQPIKHLTSEMQAELAEQETEERRSKLTKLAEVGCQIEPYVGSMLLCPDGINCGPEDRGFKKVSFGGGSYWNYTLDDWSKHATYEELPDGKFRLVNSMF